MFDVWEIKEWGDAVQCRDGVYRPARPLPTFLKQRIKDAWEVLKGRAVAVYLYSGHEVGPLHRRGGPGMAKLSNETPCLRCNRPRSHHKSWFTRPNFGGASSSLFAYCPDNSGHGFEHRCEHCSKPRPDHFQRSGRLGGSLCSLTPGDHREFTIPRYEDGVPEYQIFNAAN